MFFHFDIFIAIYYVKTNEDFFELCEDLHYLDLPGVTWPSSRLTISYLYLWNNNSQELENKPQPLRDPRGLLTVEVLEDRNNYHQIQSQYHSINNHLYPRWKCSSQRGARLVQKKLLGQKSANVGSWKWGGHHHGTSFKWGHSRPLNVSSRHRKCNFS